MASSNFRLPDELFQEVLVSKFSEDANHQHKESETEIEVFTISPVEKTRIENVSFILFSTNVAREFLKNAYSYLKDAVFSYEEFDDLWEKYQAVKVKSQEVEQELEDEREAEEHESFIIRVYRTFNLIRRIVRFTKHTIESVRKLQEAHNISAAKIEGMDLSYNSIENQYKLFLADALNASTSIVSNHLTLILDRISDFFKEHIHKHLRKRILATLQKLPTAKKIWRKLMRNLVSAGATKTTIRKKVTKYFIGKTLKGKNPLDTISFVAEMGIRTMVAIDDAVNEFNTSISDGIHGALDFGIETLQELQDSALGMKNPFEKIVHYYEGFSKSEEIITFQRLIPSVSKNPTRQKLAITNLLLGRYLNNFEVAPMEEIEKHKERLIASPFVNEVKKLHHGKDFKTAIEQNLEKFAQNLKKYTISFDYLEFFGSQFISDKYFAGDKKLGNAIEWNEGGFRERVEMIKSDDFIGTQPQNETNFVIKLYNLTTDRYLDTIESLFRENIEARSAWMLELTNIGDALEL